MKYFNRGFHNKKVNLMGEKIQSHLFHVDPTHTKGFGCGNTL